MLQQKDQRMALTDCFIECCRISIVLLYMMDDLPNFKFSETDMQIMWTYVMIRDVVEGVSMIREVLDWCLRPGKRNDIENNLFYITCFKGSITAKRSLVYGIFWGTTESYAGLDWMSGLFQDN